jgi:UDP-2,3-diacylglucosamine hydrolase
MPEGPAPPPAAAAAAPGGLPAFFSFPVPTAWRSIDFISDLHLCEALPRTFAVWTAYMRQTSADAVFILGDLFEVWVGDDARFRPFERQVLDVLAECASHRQVAFMVGNRDFLVGTALLREAGLMGLADPTVLGAWGQPILLTHGDALCLSDEPYQAFRREVRSPAWQTAFLARPLAERLRIAAEIRQVSASRRRFDGDSSADVDHAAAVRWMHAMGSAEMVHGHTHRPGSDALGPGFKRHVLSDWDLDQGHRAEVLRLSRGGFERRVPEGL